MDAKVLDTALRVHLSEMQMRLDQAAGISRAACACAGNIRKAIEIALEVDSSPMRSTPYLTPRA